jgi:hypothetical protein
MISSAISGSLFATCGGRQARTRQSAPKGDRFLSKSVLAEIGHSRNQSRPLGAVGIAGATASAASTSRAMLHQIIS